MVKNLSANTPIFNYKPNQQEQYFLLSGFVVSQIRVGELRGKLILAFSLSFLSESVIVCSSEFTPF
jgi:hypothetical protein